MSVSVSVVWRWKDEYTAPAMTGRFKYKLNALIYGYNFNLSAYRLFRKSSGTFEGSIIRFIDLRLGGC